MSQRAIDHLTNSSFLSLMKCSQSASDPKRSRYEVCQIVRRKLILLLLVDQLHDSAYRYIIQVMSWPERSRTALSIPTNPQQYDSFVNHIEIFRSESQFFQDPRTIGIDQYISIAQQFQYYLKVVLIFEINGDALFVAIEDVFVDGYGNWSRFFSCNKGHLCSLISKVQSAEDTRCQSLKFHYFELLHVVIYLIFIALLKKQEILQFPQAIPLSLKLYPSIYTVWKNQMQYNQYQNSILAADIHLELKTQSPQQMLEKSADDGPKPHLKKSGGSTLKKCAKSANSKFCTINQMTYIEQFLSQHILSYYLSSLRASTDHHLFVDHHNQRNFFSLTWEILLFGDNMAKCKSRDWLIDLVRGNLIISYDDLKDVTLPKKEHDSDSIRYIKTQFEYVYVQMHQIMIRLILAHLIIAKDEALSKEVQKLIKEIGYIYPALKTEISINCSQINLADWFQHYLTQLIEEKRPKGPFFQFLEEVKNECNMLGPIERLFEKLVKSYQHEEEYKKQKEESCFFEESRSQSMFKLSQNLISNDHEMLRKKKKIAKERSKHQNYGNNSFVTPLKAKQQFIPQTQKTELWRTQQNCESSHSHSNTSSSAFSKLLKKYKKPIVRTIYHGSTKTFVPKRQNGADISSEHFIESLTATSSLANESIALYDMNRRYSTKFTKSSFDSEDKSEFCVPETPKQDALRKLSTEKKLLFEPSPLPRLKI